jgi:2-succinyl-5-enolpyruvyl-6-hydroxy-3-cyclohexene-1-carboxylate synthase
VDREPAAHRVTDQYRAGPGGGADLGEARPERRSLGIEADAPIAFANRPGDGLPGVGALHEPGDEHDRSALRGTAPADHAAMIPLNRTLAPLVSLVDELARCGLGHAVCSPGSRNAPVVLALADDDRIATWSVLDERSAGFVALGIAKASGRPAAVACTSGTAAANLLPAVVEAREARVPLIVLTADRPPELRGVGAGQAIDQVKLYGDAVKWFVEVGNHDPGRATAIHYRALACRAWAVASDLPPGPVHLNLALREPLAPVAEELDPADWEGRPGGRPWVTFERPAADPGPELAGELAERAHSAERGLIVCGPGREDTAAPAAALAEAAGWPILAEPTSGLRCGPHDRSRVVAHYDAFLRDRDWARRHRPELVLRVGDTPTSKPLRAFLAGAEQIVVDPDASWNEPTRTAARHLACGAAATLRALAAGLGARAPGEEWVDAWLAADALVAGELAAAPDPFEPKAYAGLAGSLPDGATVWLSSSMPVRDVETFFPSVDTALRFLANRGANGIDGVVSSAVGAALASAGPCTLLTGELALLHDVSGLIAARRLGAELTIVCVNNGGGGIFDFLPVAETAAVDDYERLIATPHEIDLEPVAALAGLAYTRASTAEEVRRAAAVPGLVELRTDRAANVREHRALFERVAQRLGALR